MRYYDISPLITESIAVFPGDTPFTRQTLCSFAAGNNLALSAINSTVHLGAHADAPNHYHADGQGIDSVNLDNYLGLCQVIDVSQVSHADNRLKVADVACYEITQPRVLLKTQSFPEPNHWHDDFMALSPELIAYLAEAKVKLIGIDTPSVDPAKDQELKSHQQIYQAGMSILEGLLLTDIAAGCYQLIALPLKIKDADASPVRAILLPLTEVGVA